MYIKSILIGMLFILPFYVSAQTEKGRFIVSGVTSMDFSYTMTKLNGEIKPSFDRSSKNLNLTIGSSAGYFVIDNLATGMELLVSTQKDKDNNRLSVFGVIPELTYYFLDDRIIRPFLQAGIGYMQINMRMPLGSEETKRHFFNGFIWGGAAGVSFFVRNNISIDLAAEYASFKTKHSEELSQKMKVDGFGGLIGFSLFF